MYVNVCPFTENRTSYVNTPRLMGVIHSYSKYKNKAMEDGLELPVTYKGQELLFPLKVVPQGYVYRFVVQIDDLEVVYEKDDAGEYRAVIAKPDEYKGKLPEKELLEAICEVIVSLTEK
jgi:hypothetical protein